MTKCVICFAEHDRTYNGSPALFCGDCAVLKKDMVGQVSHIIHNIHISDLTGASTFEGTRICVHEDVPSYEGDCIHLPILAVKPNSHVDRNGAVASIEALDSAAELIGHFVEMDKPLLVHCKGGVERSPLTVAWYLVKSKHFNTLLEAYDFLKAKRPVISQRLFWLPY